MSAGMEPGAAVSRPGLRASPGRAPACGARTRAGGSCLGLAMASGRCRIHGGASTGPRTAVGLARMVAAKTTHGRFAVSGAPKRLDWRFARTVVARIRLTAEATMLQEYLPAGMAARLDSVPEELLAPKHPSQVAFEALQAAAGCTSVPARLGLGRRARARLGAGGRVVDGAAAALHGRATERLGTRAETASQAPWRAAIAAARALRQAMDGARGQVRGASNDPMGGTAGIRTPNVRNDPMGGAGRQTRAASNDPMGGTAGYRTPDVCNDPMGGTGRQTRSVSNDPMGGMAGYRTPDVRNDPMRGTGRQTRAAINDAMGGMAGHRTPDGRNDPMGGTGRQTRGASNDPMGGMAGYRTPDGRNDPIGGTGRQTRVASNDPMGGTAGHRTPDGRNDLMGGTGRQTRAASNDPMGGTAGYRTPDRRNDPMGGTAVRVRSAGAPSDARVGVLAERRADETIEWAPGSRGLWEALAREVEKRRLRAEAGRRGNDPSGNDPIGGNAAGAGAAGGAQVVLAVTGSGSVRGLALGSTTLARIWEPSLAEVLAARLGPAAVQGWPGTAVAPPGIAAMPDGGGTQRPCMRPAGSVAAGGWGR